MRREEFTVTDQQELLDLAHEVTVGSLGLGIADEYPRVIPLNFVLMNGNIYFHGADAGEKFFVFETKPKVTFSIYKEYSLIPSYWTARDYACPATAFFKSVFFKGTGSLVDSTEEKAAVLQALMVKYQPEGGYRTITTEDSLYRKALKEVAIYKIHPTETTMKFKFGQQYSESKKLMLIEKLLERNIGPDKETAMEIRKRGL